MGIQGSYLMARKPLWDGRRMGWDRGQLYQGVSAQSIWLLDTAECWGVVWQREFFSVITGKRNISWIGLVLKTKSGDDIMKVNHGVVVKTHKLLWELFC